MATANPTKPEPVVPVAEQAKPKKAKVQHQVMFGSEAEAVAAAESRTKGPRRAFKCTHGGKDFFVVHNNEGRAMGAAFAQIGGSAVELGKKARVPKAIGAEGILAAINALPEGEREGIMAQLKALQPKK